MKIGLIGLIVFFSSLVFGQGMSNQSFDLGEVDAYSDRYVDIPLTNKTGKKIYVLRVETGPELSYRISNTTLLPDSTSHLRVQVNPIKKGPFNYTVLVHMSDRNEPLKFTINGTLKSVISYSSELTKCPEFGAKPVSINKTSELTIITVDKQTGEPLSKSTVTIIRNGEPAGTWITGNSGKFKDKIPPGYFYFFATHEGYENKEAGVYVGPEISEITIPLKRNKIIEEPVAVVVEEDPVQLPPEQVETALEEQINSEPQDSSFAVSFPELAAIPEDNFDNSYFNDVNVMFVLDVSASMKMGEKMDLMKFSLNQLVDQLRPGDRMGIVTYSSKASVLVSPTSGGDKTILKDAISGLKAGGMTAGGLGIKLAYKQVMKHYDASKTNMVIIITDGAFNKDSDDYKKVVKKYAKKGIVFSVVGIQTKENDQKLMTEAAKVGNGRFVLIEKLGDAYHNLKREIRIATYKGK